MWLTLTGQTAYFLWSIALGAAASLIYDLVCAVRQALRAGKLHLLISDALFFIVCGVLTSLFALPFNKGSVRAFIVFGEAAGFLLCRLTIGRATGRIYSILSKLILWILKKICDLLKNFFDFLLKTTALVVYNVSELVEACKRKLSAHHKRKENSRCKGSRRRGQKKRRNGYEKRNQKENQNPLCDGRDCRAR